MQVGFPNMRRTILGDPITRNKVFGGLYWGPAITETTKRHFLNMWHPHVGLPHEAWTHASGHTLIPLSAILVATTREGELPAKAERFRDCRQALRAPCFASSPALPALRVQGTQIVGPPTDPYSMNRYLTFWEYMTNVSFGP